VFDCQGAYLLKVPRRRGWHSGFKICPRHEYTFPTSIDAHQRTPAEALNLTLLFHDPLETQLHSAPAQLLLELSGKSLETLPPQVSHPKSGGLPGEDLLVTLRNCIWLNWHMLEGGDGDINLEIGVRSADVVQK
jgi:hypothetical protein